MTIAAAKSRIFRTVPFCVFFVLVSNFAFAGTWYIDGQATGTNDGTSWANAWPTLAAATGVSSGDTVYISGGPSGTSQTYSATILPAFPGQWTNVVNGATYQIGQDSLHNGTAIFNVNGGSYWLFQGWQNVTISGDAGDGQQHFACINCTQGGRGDNWTNVHITYIAFGNVFTGISINPSGGGIEIDHCTATVTGASSNNFSSNTTSGSAFDIDKFHDNVIQVPRDSSNNGFGDDVLDWNGNGQSVYNNTFISYPIGGYTGGQHQDGWQSEGGSFLKYYNNRCIDFSNYAFFGEAASAGFQHVRIFNNICSISYGNTTQALVVSATDALPANDVVVANNLADGYQFPYTFRNPGSPSDPGAFSACVFRNNVDLNSGSPSIIDPAVASSNNASLSAAQAVASYVSYVVGSTSNNYHTLFSDAFTVDKGFDLSAYFDTDFDGTIRPQGPAWDIGPYEQVVSPTPVFYNPPSPTTQSVAPSATVVFTATARGAATITYVWDKNGVPLVDGGDISGSQTATLTLTGVTSADAGTYNAVATNGNGSSTSSGAALSISVPPAITTQPSAAIVSAGTTVMFTVVATGSPAPTYQWKINGTNLTDGPNVSGSSTATLTLSNVAIANDGTYTVLITNTGGNLLSNGALLAVQTPPAFTVQPNSTTVAPGANVSFTVAASGVPTPTIQWQYNGSNITDGGIYSGSTTTTLTLTGVALVNAGQYTAVATNILGNATSAIGALNVTNAPIFTLQPTNQTVVSGGSVTFSATAVSAQSQTYQWQLNGVNVPGATSSSLTLSNVTVANGGNYTLIATNATSSVTSNGAVLTVNDVPHITTQPSSQAVTNAAAVTFSVSATGSSLSYQWSKNGNPIGGATGSSYSISNASPSDNGTYTVIVSNSFGSVTSSSASLVVGTGPAVVIQPQSQNALVGGSVSFTVSASGVPTPSYQWYFNGAVIVGATSGTLTLSNISNSNAGNYMAVATNSDGAATSNGATLTVSVPGHLANISARATSGQGAQILIAGFVLSGASKKVLVRGIGPSLEGFGITGFLPNPTLDIFQASTEVASDSGWGGSADLTQAFTETGAFALASNSLDSAVLTTLAPGGYTAQVSGSGGVALAEIYDDDITPTGYFINLSARSQVGTGDQELIAGLVIEGATPMKVLIRAIGPALTSFGVTGVLALPELQIFQGQTLLQQDLTGWAGNPQLSAAFAEVGAFPLPDPSSADVAVIVTLNPGAYTAIVSGQSSSSGIALVEVYALP